MVIVPRCHDRRCIHLVGVRQPDGTESSERNICLAYPDGIPLDIEAGDDLHLEVREDQNNDIVYEREET